jgi:hypothetical protein
MTEFFAQPPLPLWYGSGGSLVKKILRIFRGFHRMMWQALVPFNSYPEEPRLLPEPAGEIDESQLEECQWIFDQTEDRRTGVEQKAQSTFTIIVFLVPLLASLFVFLAHTTPSNAWGRVVGILFLLVSGFFLLLGFISIVRAVSVKYRETLFFGAVLEDDGQFRKYNRGFHARGLLRCAAMNTAMNDHIAQFVKGAQVFTACGLVALLIAAIPATIALSRVSSVMQTRIVDPIQVSSQQLAVLTAEVAKLRDGLATLVGRSNADEIVRSLGERVTKIESELRSLQKSSKK